MLVRDQRCVQLYIVIRSPNLSCSDFAPFSRVLLDRLVPENRREETRLLRTSHCLSNHLMTSGVLPLSSVHISFIGAQGVGFISPSSLTHHGPRRLYCVVVRHCRDTCHCICRQMAIRPGEHSCWILQMYSGLISDASVEVHPNCWRAIRAHPVAHRRI